jgi:chromosome segregation ATPase
MPPKVESKETDEAEVESRIRNIENRLKEIELSMEAVETNYEELNRLFEKKVELSKNLEETMEVWISMS